MIVSPYFTRCRGFFRMDKIIDDFRIIFTALSLNNYKNPASNIRPDNYQDLTSK